MANDQLVDIFARISFDTNVFADLDKAAHDQATFEQFFRMPNVMILWSAWHVVQRFDTNDCEDPDHKAFCNLLKWMILKMLTDPVWFSYLGHFMWFISVHANPSSYYPLMMHDRFIPGKWYKRGEEVDVVKEHTENCVRPDDAFEKVFRRKQM